MHDTLSRRTSQPTALPEANRAVAQSVLQLLPPNLFDGLGTLKSIWLHRLESGAIQGDQAPSVDDSVAPLESDEYPIPDPGQSHLERWYQ
jgi:hypothetical protein